MESRSVPTTRRTRSIGIHGLRRSGRRRSAKEISVAKDIEDMSEDDVREALLAVDREEVRQAKRT